MDRDQRSRRQKSGGGSFARTPQKRSVASRIGLQKNTAPRRADSPVPDPTRRPAQGEAQPNPQKPQNRQQKQKQKQKRRAQRQKQPQQRPAVQGQTPQRTAPQAPAAPQSGAEAQRRPTQQINPQKPGYESGLPPRQRRVTKAELLRRRRQRRFLGVLAVLAALAIGGIVSVNLLFKVTAFRIETFDRTTPADTGVYTEDQIITALGIEQGSNLFGFSTADKTQLLQAALPYLDRVQVNVQLPGTVVVKVEPATERYACMYAGGWVVLSDAMRILRIETDEPQGLIELHITLPDGFAPAVGQTVAPATYNSLLDTEQQATDETANVQATASEVMDELLTCLKEQNLFDGLTALDMTDLSSMSFIYQGRVSVKLGNSSNLEYKLRLAASALLDTDKGISGSEHGTLDVSYQQSDGEIKGYFQPEAVATPTPEPTQDPAADPAGDTAE